MNEPLRNDERVYKKRDKRRYIRLTLDGASCVMTPREAESAMAEDPDLEPSEVWMTPAEFEALPEFGGF